MFCMSASSRGASRLPPVVAAGSRCFKKLDILTFLPPSETGDSHTPVSDQGECPPPPLAQTAQPVVQRGLPRARGRAQAGGNLWNGNEREVVLSEGGMWGFISAGDISCSNDTCKHRSCHLCTRDVANGNGREKMKTVAHTGPATLGVCLGRPCQCACGSERLPVRSCCGGESPD